MLLKYENQGAKCDFFCDLRWRSFHLKYNWTWEAALARIFICYRRDDVPHAAGRIADHLTQQLGDQSVFRDVETLEATVDYTQRILNEIPNSDVLLAIIGSNWPLSQERLFDENELLRQELEYAVRLRVPVIPVLIDKASPEEDHWPEIPEASRKA
jgi:hypothetical protein